MPERRSTRTDALTEHGVLALPLHGTLGQIETTLRLALGGQWRVPLAWIEWDVGENFVWNAGHQLVVNETEFVAQLRATLMWKTWGRL